MSSITMIPRVQKRCLGRSQIALVTVLQAGCVNFGQLESSKLNGEAQRQ